MITPFRFADSHVTIAVNSSREKTIGRITIVGPTQEKGPIAAISVAGPGQIVVRSVTTRRNIRDGRRKRTGQLLRKIQNDYKKKTTVVMQLSQGRL